MFTWTNVGSTTSRTQSSHTMTCMWTVEAQYPGLDGQSDAMAPQQQQARIVSLIPSATDICVHLGLADCVVGISHCCDRDQLNPSVLVVTEDQVHAASISQAEIQEKVVENAHKAANTDLSSCSLDEVPSLYPIDTDLLKKANPNLIITQDLCHVCAPSSKTVFKALNEAGIEAKVVLLTPSTLQDVILNMQQVADAAGIAERGKEKCQELQAQFDQLKSVIDRNLSSSSSSSSTSPLSINRTLPTVLLMEWVDPPFCGGHWIVQMMELVGVAAAIAPNADGRSRQVTWKEIQEADPDVTIVACCGLDLKRNLRDAATAKDQFVPLQCSTQQRLFAANGDQYFARPSPKLLTGTVIMALCTYSKKEFPELVRQIELLDFASQALESYQHLSF